MHPFLLTLLILHFLSWGLSWLPQIRIFLPRNVGNRFRFNGVSICCFCVFTLSRRDFESSELYKKVALHEYRHQWQQRILSPALLAFLYYGEWLFRMVFLKQSAFGAYSSIFWEKDANRYMERESLDS